MKRPLFLFSGMFVLGEVLGFSSFYKNFYLPAGAAILLLISGLIFYIGKSRWTLLFPFFFLFGMIHCRNVVSPMCKIPSLINEQVVLEGDIEAMEAGQMYRRIYLKNTSYRLKNIQYPVSGVLVNYSGSAELKIGNRIIVHGVMDSFEAPGNPGQFSFQDYYRPKKISYRMKGDRIEVSVNKQNYFRQKMHEWREYFGIVLEEVMSPVDSALYRAVLLGDKSRLEPDTRDTYQSAGISHLLSISGLHVSIIGMGIFRGMRKAGVSFSISSALSLGLMLCFCVIAGEGTSAIRAVLMFGVHVMGNSLGRTYDLNTALGISALVLFYENPFYLLAPGVQLSYGAVLGISVIRPEIKKIIRSKSRLWDALTVNLAVQAVTLPISLYHFYEYPRYGMILNLIVVPMMGLALISGLCAVGVGCIFTLAGTMMAGPGHIIFMLYGRLSSFFMGLPFSRHVVGKPYLWQIILFYTGIAVIIYILPKAVQKVQIRSLTWILAGLCLSCQMFFPMRLERGKLMITVLDVGQGDGIFINSPQGQHFFIDGGSLNVSEVGRNRLIPFLKYYGVSHLEYYFLTHWDQDHINGAQELLMNQREMGITVKNLVISYPMSQNAEFSEFSDEVKSRGTGVITVKKGDRIREGALEILCLSPDRDEMPRSDNDGSIVLQVKYGKFSALLTGDLEESGERKILSSWEIKPCVLLKVGHHGSKTSSCAPFIQALQPELAVISCGRGNSFGHPHEKVLAVLEEAEASVYQTPERGAVGIVTDGRTWRLQTFRKGDAE